MSEQTDISEADGNRPGGEAVIEIGDRYVVHLGERRPDVQIGMASAVRVSDRKVPNDPLFARICPLEISPRVAAMTALKGVTDTNFMRPLDWLTFTHPVERKPVIAIIFRKPIPELLAPVGADTFEALPTDVVNRTVLGSLCLALGVVAQRGITHRAIRPDNIYWDGDSRNHVILGECVSHAPAMLQPAVFESTEVALTPPLARGAGSPRDDFYALGTTLLALATGRIPMAGKSDKQIIEEKLQRGSYSAMMDGQQPPLGLRELLRGLLADNPDDRWGFEEIEQWLGGGQRSTVREIRSGSADRPFDFAGGSYKNCRLLASAFGDNRKKAEKTIYASGFHSWLKRGFAESNLATSIAQVLALGFEGAASENNAARKLARVCMALDRFGPIRFDGLCTMPAGLGALLLKAFVENDKPQIDLIGRAITEGVINDWYDAQSNADRIDYVNEIKEFQQVAQLAKHQGPGYGLERCLYSLCPNVPCLSPIFQGRTIAHIRDLLPALEEIVEREGELPVLVDNHLAAFIAGHIKTNIDRQLIALEGAFGDTLAVKLRMLSILARVQDKHGPEELPALSQWFAGELQPVIDRFNSKSTREKLQGRIKALGVSGNLVELANCLASESAQKSDEDGRSKAASEFAAASREISQLESREFEESAQRLGWKIAVGISNTILGATVVTTLLVSG